MIMRRQGGKLAAGQADGGSTTALHCQAHRRNWPCSALNYRLEEGHLGTLYVVATPIGNLEDITLRAMRVLGEVGLVAAEDTRSARRLLTHYKLKARCVSFFEANKIARLPSLLEALEQGDVALLSDAGTPVISDPGRELVTEAAERGFPVVSLPGASAVTSALAISGFDANSFRFSGFLPRRATDRRRALTAMASGSETMVIFEAPHRLRVCLRDMLDMLGDRHVAVCRELTKMYEEVFRGAISHAIAHFEEPRGEFTLVVQGAPDVAVGVDPEEPLRELQRLKASGIKAKEAVGTVSQAWGLPRREAYRLWLSLPVTPEDAEK